MESENNKETFLSDWLAGKITDEQLQALVDSDDFKAYQKLKQALGSYAVSEPNLAANYAAVKAKRIEQLNRKPTKVFSLYRYAAVAAMVILLLGAYQLFFFSNKAITDFGKTAIVNLNDHSKVTLNAKSEISYATLFKFNRKIKLEGEAFFEVAKGSTFTVKTAQGDVQVLGTKFNVIAKPDIFEVVCFEGRVKVKHGNQTNILTRGQAIRFYKSQLEKWTQNEPRPLWIGGESSFRKSPLQSVISAFENQYDYQVSYPQKIAGIRFTGSFTHQNMETALQSICLPMNLQYSITDSGKIILSE